MSEETEMTSFKSSLRRLRDISGLNCAKREGGREGGQQLFVSLAFYVVGGKSVIHSGDDRQMHFRFKKTYVVFAHVRWRRRRLIDSTTGLSFGVFSSAADPRYAQGHKKA